MELAKQLCASRLYQRPSVYWSMDDAVTLIDIELLVFTLSCGQDFEILNNNGHETDKIGENNNNNNNKHENVEIKKLPQALMAAQSQSLDASSDMKWRI